MRLTIEGYKSIGEARSIDINGLTVLSGANSSGKSSFMQPMLLIKQTLESEFDAGSLLLDGPNVRVTDSTQIATKVAGRAAASLSVTLEEGGSSATVRYRFSKRVGIQVESVTSKSDLFPEGITITPKMTSNVIRESLSKATERLPIARLAQEQSTTYSVVRDGCFLDIVISIKRERHPVSFPIGISPSYLLERNARSLIHVPGLRGNPERSYKTAASENKFPGSFERYVASIVHAWRTKAKYKNKFAKILDQLKSLGLATSLSTSPINETRLELRVSRYSGESMDADDHVNIADVGFGVSQTLPVLVALLAANKGQIVYVEQPELHLHPRAQFRLAEVIADAVKRGVLVVIETHSSILIRGIQILVAKRQLEGKSVSLHWFTQNKITGQSEVSTAELDEYGAFGDWPEDFDSVALDVEGEYLDAVEEASHGR